MRLGAHVSIRGAIHLAIDRAVAVGCECLQIFVGSPRQWRPVRYPEHDLELFIQKRQRAHLDPLVAHGAYLINLATPDPNVHRLSIGALTYAARTMDRVGGLGTITHVGSRGQRSWPEALRRITTALEDTLAATSRSMILLENSVGAGGQVGGTLEELHDILAAMNWHARLGICLDSAHLFAAGWDLRGPQGVETLARHFDRIVGLQWLRAWHLNDAKSALGSHLDRHENIGAGQIGRRGFAALVRHRAFNRLPAFIETPGFDREGPDRKNLQILKRLRAAGLRKRTRPRAARGEGRPQATRARPGDG